MTDKLRAAAEMALEALEEWRNHDTVEAMHIFETITVPETLQALRQALAEPDMGIDRGAWSDVPDATKWVDELRGDELEFECPRCGHCCQQVEEPPNSTTDVVEPIGWFTEDHETDKSATTYNAETARRWLEKGWPVTPLYTAPPQSDLLNQTCCECGRSGGYALYCGDCWNKTTEWQGLTGDELLEMFRIDAGCFGYGRAVEAKLKERNT